MKIIDSHQHFWKLSRADYDWISPDLKVLYRDYLPNDLDKIIEHTAVHSTIIVQATDTMEETEYLLSLAEQYDWIIGVVGWVNLEHENVSKDIENLAKNKYFRGIRPMIQSIEDDHWMLKNEIQSGIKTLTELKLTFDALVLPRHLPILHEFAKNNPQLKIIIDHGAKPNIEDGQSPDWFENMISLSKLDNVFCKLSGLLTEAKQGADVDDLLPYMEHLLVHFGSDKLMFGSDWPVLNLNGSYNRWLNYVSTFVSKLPSVDQQNILYETAISVYRLESTMAN